MPASFLDTTILINATSEDEVRRRLARNAIANFQPSSTPAYAIRELLAGYIRIACEAHNRILAAKDIGEALLNLLSASPFEGRKKEARARMLGSALSRAIQQNPEMNRTSLKGEIADDIALTTARVWKNARTLNGVSIVQPLACFVVGPLKAGVSGELRGPNDSFNCTPTVRCSAAGYLYDDQAALSKMCEALHPSKTSRELEEKRETKQRRKALKLLQHSGQKNFNKRLCRSLGDAYFVGMCPPSHTLLSTNTIDFRPLCIALDKKLAQP
ncbi:MAG: hypothetical protein JNM79_05195 [Burkholderiales bacterium]|nr:hypothetical protein [Burkholderiales bacterium]